MTSRRPTWQRREKLNSKKRRHGIPGLPAIGPEIVGRARINPALGPAVAFWRCARPLADSDDRNWTYFFLDTIVLIIENRKFIRKTWLAFQVLVFKNGDPSEAGILGRSYP